MHLASGFRIGNFLSVIPSFCHTFQSEIRNKLVWKVIVLNVTFPKAVTIFVFWLKLEVSVAYDNLFKIIAWQYSLIRGMLMMLS